MLIVPTISVLNVAIFLATQTRWSEDGVGEFFDAEF
jgi:hypothetical protein